MKPLDPHSTATFNYKWPIFNLNINDSFTHSVKCYKARSPDMYKVNISHHEQKLKMATVAMILFPPCFHEKMAAPILCMMADIKTITRHKTHYYCT